MEWKIKEVKTFETTTAHQFPTLEQSILSKAFKGELV